MRENKKGGALSKVQKLKRRLSQSFGKLGKKVRLQSSANELSLGCVIPASWSPLGARFTQPRDHSLADPCICTVRNRIFYNSDVSPVGERSQKSGNRNARRKKVCRTKEARIFTKGSYRRFVSALLFFDQHFNGETRVGGGCVILATMVHSS